MNINRNNYEEYFLMYVDNELSAADKNMLEAFVAANADLQEELLMLQQSIIKPDDVEFSGKEKLLKQEIIDAATQENLLLLLDNEFSIEEKQSLQSLIQKDKAVQQEWQVLQQTKLPPENIIFDNKASLYRTENTRVVPMKWWRMAAAAMLIGFGLWGTVSYFNKTDNSSTIVETVTNNKPSSFDIDKIDTALVKKEQKNIVENKSLEKTTDVAQTTGTKNPVEKVNTSKEAVQKVLPKYKEEKYKEEKNLAAAPEKKIIIAVPEVQQIINNSERNKNNIASVTPETNTNKPESTNESLLAPRNSFASNTSLTDNKTYNTFDDVDEDKPKRSKVGGFFKQVKRVLERKTKIKTGNGDDIRIANMSFAMH